MGPTCIYFKQNRSIRVDYPNETEAQMVLSGLMVRTFVEDDELFVLVLYRAACNVDIRKLYEVKVYSKLSVIFT